MRWYQKKRLGKVNLLYNKTIKLSKRVTKTNIIALIFVLPTTEIRMKMCCFIT